MSSERDRSEQVAILLEDTRSGYAMGYRDGALAERSRVLAICDAARTHLGNIPDTAVAVAVMVQKAADNVPYSWTPPRSQNSHDRLVRLRNTLENDLDRARHKNRNLLKRNAGLREENDTLRRRIRQLQRLFDNRKTP